MNLKEVMMKLAIVDYPTQKGSPDRNLQLQVSCTKTPKINTLARDNV